MYRAITSLWSRPASSKKVEVQQDVTLDEDSWVFVSDTGVPASLKSNNLMNNSWIEPISSHKKDETTVNANHFNPIENLLIEHASMSVYEQIASKTQNRHQKKILHGDKLDEQTEEDDEDDDDGKIIFNHPHPTLTSFHHRTMNTSLNPFATTFESSTISHSNHHRHLQRLHQRRKRANKSTSKLLADIVDEQTKQELSENINSNKIKAFLPSSSYANNEFQRPHFS